ncbi:MAG: response regulator [Acidobacteria bacterium]|nr:response regulator [Acidobacteriota bacterium]MBI3426974.1 response regulator [Acidobacteriota bacterium]
MRALVIDDSKAMRMIVSNILKGCGFTVVEAIHGQDGLAKLSANETFDLVLVDWNMPEMNGFEFLQTVRAQPCYAELRVMMVTTETEIENMTQALEAGANEYIMKPFTKDGLREKLEMLGLPLA